MTSFTYKTFDHLADVQRQNQLFVTDRPAMETLAVDRP